MAFWKNKQKKPIELSAEEKEHLKKALEIYKKFFKPLKGEIIVKKDGCDQPWVMTARYFTEDDMKKDAKKIVQALDSASGKKCWKISSAKIVQKIDEKNNDSDTNI